MVVGSLRRADTNTTLTSCSGFWQGVGEATPIGTSSFSASSSLSQSSEISDPESWLCSTGVLAATSTSATLIAWTTAWRSALFGLDSNLAIAATATLGSISDSLTVSNFSSVDSGGVQGCGTHASLGSGGVLGQDTNAAGTSFSSGEVGVHGTAKGGGVHGTAMAAATSAWANKSGVHGQAIMASASNIGMSGSSFLGSANFSSCPDSGSGSAGGADPQQSRCPKCCQVECSGWMRLRCSKHELHKS
mmetsp:Transcript_38777/g.61076  ORF Transcript_38777/g.61076 Transcript_38777/m.61076 type:complete len:247 (-) Transcript_38777:668-1408(-)